MRLLFVIDSLGSGGAQRQMVTLAVELARRGHHVAFFLYAKDEFFADKLKSAGIGILRHVKPSRYSIQPVLRLRKLMRGGGYDAVLSFLSVPNLYSLIAARTTSRTPPLVVSERWCRVSGLINWQDRIADRCLGWADGIVTNSHHVRKYFQRKYPKLQERLGTIWNGVDSDQFQGSPLPTTGADLQLLTVGRMVHYKNWRLLAEALVILRDRYAITPHVSWIGRDQGLSPGDQAYYDQVKTILSHNRLTDQWTWLGRRKDVAELLRAHHALVHPSCIEGLPNAVCEALASGRPVVASNSLDHPLLVEEGKTGYLFDPKSADALASAIKKLNDLSGDALQAMGRGACEFAHERLSISRMADEYEAMFRRVCGAEGASRIVGT